jgi:hypothetical protein
MCDGRYAVVTALTRGEFEFLAESLAGRGVAGTIELRGFAAQIEEAW